MLAHYSRVVDAVWAAAQAHLPSRPPDTHPLSCHRPRIPDRDCFTGILVRLVSGCSRDVAARLTPAGETTVGNRRTEWREAGVFNKLVEVAIAGCEHGEQIEQFVQGRDRLGRVSRTSRAPFPAAEWAAGVVQHRR